MDQKVAQIYETAISSHAPDQYYVDAAVGRYSCYTVVAEVRRHLLWEGWNEGTCSLGRLDCEEIGPCRAEHFHIEALQFATRNIDPNHSYLVTP